MNYGAWPEVTIFAFPMKMCLKMLYALFNLRYIIFLLVTWNPEVVSVP